MTGDVGKRIGAAPQHASGLERGKHGVLGDAAEFDELVVKGRRRTMQPMDIVEIMEWKALSALRAGRHSDGVRFLEEALANADHSARLMSVRIRAQLEQASARAAS